MSMFICDDSDIDVLCQYVVALLKNDAPWADIEEACKSQLHAFLEGQTDAFVGDMFRHLRELEKSMPAHTAAQSSEPVGRKRKPSVMDTCDERLYKPNSRSGDEEIKRRRYDDRPRRGSEPDDRYDTRHGFPHHNNKDSHSHPYPSSNSLGHGHSNNPNNATSSNNSRERRDSIRQNNRPPPPMHGMPGRGHYDPYDYGRGGDMGPPGVDMRPPQRRKERCRDFEEKGVCMRGDDCIYDHGAHPVIVEQVQGYNPAPLDQDEYDPSNPRIFEGSSSRVRTYSSMSRERSASSYGPDFKAGYSPERNMGPHYGGMDGPNSTGQDSGPGPRYEGRGAGPRGGRGRGRGRGRGGRPDCHIPNAPVVSDKSLLVVNLRADQNNVAALTEYFKQFGTVQSINALHNNEKSSAHVTFADAEMAKKAYGQQSNVMGGDVVKLFYAPIESHHGRRDGYHGNGGSKPTDCPNKKDSEGGEPKIPVKEYTEAQKKVLAEYKARLEVEQAKEQALLAIEKKRKENKETRLRQMRDVQKAKADLMKAQIEQQKKLIAKLSEKGLKKEKRVELMGTLRRLSQAVELSKKFVTTYPSAAKPKPIHKEEDKRAALDKELDMMVSKESPSETPTHSTGTEDLESRLAAMKQEAVQMGLLSRTTSTTNAIDATTNATDRMTNATDTTANNGDDIAIDDDGQDADEREDNRARSWRKR
ncbi:hypothetical protein, variant [Sphaeroforma arctica JP610]|uniref:C3H1-type domain-containing protein n=1 Tax=Sphaeroforma arctica JP610 TaxID=667725 RepID=A0A0L0FW41_9EUKA|nr:hypothetical protein, variant [Sphaeroforma arctica JP610]KNC81047.1 hypothetical protein, variant [Sphaeroforma arctica JP610]|eukprot:XP_014154949.1 hypothetical protein, variant [Sphaeroforma arctica JP610]